MPDTVRTLAALQALLADNTAGDISAQDIRDFLVSSYPTAEGRPKSATETAWTKPGVSFVSVSVGTMTVNEIRYEPFLVTSPLEVDALGVEVSTAVGGGLLRVGLYEADFDYQPGALVVEGEVSGAATGLKTVVVSETLNPGRYVSAINANNGSIQTRRLVSGSIGDIMPNIGTSPFIAKISVATAYGALGDPGLAWDTLTAFTTPNFHMVFLRLATPA